MVRYLTTYDTRHTPIIRQRILCQYSEYLVARQGTPSQTLRQYGTISHEISTCGLLTRCTCAT